MTEQQKTKYKEVCKKSFNKAKDSLRKTNPALSAYFNDADTDEQCQSLVYDDDAKFESGFMGLSAKYGSNENNRQLVPLKHLLLEAQRNDKQAVKDAFTKERLAYKDEQDMLSNANFQKQQQERLQKEAELEANGISFRPAQYHRSSGKNVWEKCETYKGKNCVSKDDLVGTCGYYQRQYINPENGRTEMAILDQPKRLKIPGSTQAFDYPVTLSQCGARTDAKTTTNGEIDMTVGGKKSLRKKRKNRKTKKYNIKK